MNKIVILLTTLILIMLLYSGVAHLAEHRQMILCYYTGNPYVIDWYNCELVPRGKGW